MIALWFCLAYLLGSFPSGYLIFKLGEKKDIRSYGSQSTGATNVLRLKGWHYALPVLAIDVLKAFLPVWLALRSFSDRRIAIGMAFLVVVGHCFPVFIKFRGGKGVSTAMGSYIALAPLPFLGSVAVFVGVIALSRFVSLGSILATLSFPVFAYLFGGDLHVVWLGLAVFAVVAVRHAGNIRRLIHGDEKKFGQRVEV
ncbi:MAG: glycerol-3-phosphate 1-O-acyltransferase PlsY [Acidobacteriota bacterium]